jgi:hypothetical protein
MRENHTYQNPWAFGKFEIIVYRTYTHYRANVQSKALHAIHLQFDIIANALEIRAEQNPNCIV